MAKRATYKFNYYDENGKRRCKTFTASTKNKAKKLSEIWESEHLNDDRRKEMTIYNVVNQYVDSKEAVLSPSTVRAYRSMVKSCIKGTPIAERTTKDITLFEIQQWISNMDCTPKTVKNRFALLQCALEMADVRLNYSRLKLPQAIKKEQYTPSTEDVAALVNYTAGQKDRTLYRAILLTSIGCLRRSEVCAITADDIHGNSITINKALVHDDVGAWVIKTTKTVQSTRTIEYPDFVIKELSGLSGRIIQCNPDALKNRFNRALKFAKLKPFSFHSLRRYGASIAHTIAPDAYVKERGGWSSNYTMERVYIKTLDDVRQKTNDEINKFFSTAFNENEAKNEANTAVIEV